MRAKITRNKGDQNSFAFLVTLLQWGHEIYQIYVNIPKSLKYFELLWNIPKSPHFTVCSIFESKLFWLIAIDWLIFSIWRKSICILKIYLIHYILRKKIQVLKEFPEGKTNVTENTLLFSLMRSNSSVLLLTCDSYTSWRTRFITSLKICVGFSIFHSVWFLLKFIFLFIKNYGLFDFKGPSKKKKKKTVNRLKKKNLRWKSFFMSWRMKF